MRKIKAPTLACPKHSDSVLHTLKYQKASGKQTSGGNRGTEWITTDWKLCEKCGVPARVKIEITVIPATQKKG